MKHVVNFFVLLLNAIVIHGYFYIHNVQMVKFPSDATTQFVYFKYMIQQAYAEGHFMWSWLYGIGGDLFAQFNYYYSTAFIWLFSLFGQNETLFDVLDDNISFAMLKVFLAGAAVYQLVLYNKRSPEAALVAGLIYSGSTVFSIHSYEFDFMTDAFVLLPIWLFVYQRFVRDGKVVGYVVMTAVVLINNFYFAYILTLYFMLFCAYTYFDEKRPLMWKPLLVYSRQAVVGYIVGGLLAAFSFLPAVYQFLQSDRLVKENVIPLLYSSYFYQNIPQLLFLSYSTTHSISLALIAAVILIGGMLYLSNKQYGATKVLVGTMLILFCIPYVYSVMNGFSAPQKRWLFLVAFTLSYAVGLYWDEMWKQTKRKWLLLWGSVCGLTACYIYYWREETLYSTYDALFLALLVAAGMAFIVNIKITRYLLMVSILLISNGLHQFIYFEEIGANYAKQGYDDYLGGVAFGNEEAMEIVHIIQAAEAEFSRTLFTSPKFLLNSGMYYGLKTNMAYQSLIPKNVHRFYKEQYNTFSESSSSVSKYRGYDNRLYLEAMMANEFKVTTKNEPAPYYYELLAETENYRIYKMPQHLQLGYALPKDATVSTQFFNQLTKAERDQLVLSAAVFENAPTNNEVLQALETAERSIDIQTLQVHGGQIEANTLTITAATGDVIIPYTRQFADGEVLLQLVMEEKMEQNFYITVDNKQLHYPGQLIWNFPLDELVVSTEAANNEIVVTLTEGTYYLQEINVLENSYAPFRQRMDTLQPTTMQNVRYVNNRLTANVQIEETSHYIVALPYSKGWTVKVDGKEVPIFEVNSMLIGFELEKGVHELTFTYTTPMLKLGVILSFIGAIILVYWVWVRRRK